MNYKMLQINEIKNDVEVTEIFVKNNTDVFTGLGSFPECITIKLEKNAIPKSFPPRRVPFKIVDKLKETLEAMCKLKVIEKCEQPSEWQSNIIVVEKSDKSIRVCLDPREINKYIVRERYEIPTIEQIKLNLMGKKYFTVLDLKDGFYQCRLDEASQKYCCFNTPFGCFKFLRLPFGLASASEKFQELTSKHFGGIKNVNVYFDDILIAGSTKEEHDTTLEEVLRKVRESNIKFNPKKVQFMKEKVKFLGFVFGSEGVEPDKDRITSIIELKEPNNRKELQSFIGMINYLRGFIPNLSELVTPFRVLLKKDILWEWGLKQQKSFDQLK
jgi:hypothetical protein